MSEFNALEAVAERRLLEFVQTTAGVGKITRKRIRAELAVDSYVSLAPRNGRYNSEQLARRNEFERRFLAIDARSDG